MRPSFPAHHGSGFSQPRTVVLHAALEQDDHDAPALLVRGDGRYLAMYSTHGADNLIHYRISRQPGDPTSWQPERTFRRPAAVTYSNLFRLAEEDGGKGRIYDFYRGEGWNPNAIASDDDGQSWTYLGRLVAHDGRPYVKYASNGADTIHFVFTEGHPNEFKPGTGIYHAYYQRGNLYRSDGTFVRKLSDGPITPDEATKIVAGSPTNIAWPCDLHLDEQGRPRVAYSVSKDRQGTDHRYHYARWDGTRWHDREIAYAGSPLYRREQFYTGNVALNPQNLDELCISTDADPLNGRPLVSKADGKRHWEIFKGLTHDRGNTWAWTPVTANSTADNLRPIIPIGNEPFGVLLWLRGTYRTFCDWNLQVVGERLP